MGKGCEDAIHFTIVRDEQGGETVICCASDGAGSAEYAAFASALCTDTVGERLAAIVAGGRKVEEADIYSICEEVYDTLKAEADRRETDLNEFSCTLLGCCVSGGRSVFFQIGDGAIVRNDSTDFFRAVWWPHNGEYLNSTAFLVDDNTLKDLRILVTDEPVAEVALFTDGLQMLALNMDGECAHQPFFHDLFRIVRMAVTEEDTAILGKKLEEYLDSDSVNRRTDDDKTLFLATRL
jgi:hypothetical protein